MRNYSPTDWNRAKSKLNSSKRLIGGFLLIFISILFTNRAVAQQPDKFVSKGNNLYRQGEYAKAADQYRKSLERKPDNALTNFNLANALYRQQQFADAEQVFTRDLENTTDPAMLNRIYYNKGLAHTRKKELEQSIDAYKQALIHDPTDADARYNLQIALRELNKNKQSDKKEKKDNQQKDQKQQQQKSKLNKKQVENLLKALQQREQDVQRKYQQNRSRATSQPEKDW
jgi:Ca-activated chloride channel family protein